MPEQEGLTPGEENFARRAGYSDPSLRRMRRAGRPDKGNPRVAILSLVVAVVLPLLIQGLKPSIGKGRALLVGLVVAAVLLTGGVVLDRRRAQDRRQ